ncbi:MAG TPA: hypothetical protein VGJ66_18125 [Pyrinomonadaceae bacterium]
MTCCITNDEREAKEPGESVCTAETLPEIDNCRRCEGQGRSVSRKTILLMLKFDLLEQAMSGSYSFCPARECPVVYFDDEGNHQFTVNDLRIRVRIKVKDDPIPLCYCFGFEESDIRDEIARTGSTTIPERVSSLIREGLCACDARNPAGVCCLGEVNKVAKLLKTQRSESTASNDA